MSRSKGEEKIKQILLANRIKFFQEVSFDDLHGSRNNLLRFDFEVDRNDKILFLLEFDGRQHFEYIPYFHKNPSNFSKAREWDRRKNSYCLRNNIILLRIPFWRLDVLSLNDILTNKDYVVKTKWHNDNIINGGIPSGTINNT